MNLIRGGVDTRDAQKPHALFVSKNSQSAGVRRDAAETLRI